MSKSCNRLLIAASIFVIVLTIYSDAHARSLGVSWVSGPPRNFMCDDVPDIVTSVSCSIPEDLNAGVVPQMNWNNSDPLQITQSDTMTIGTNDDIASPMADVLVDDAGVATGVQIGWTAKGTWRTPTSFDSTAPDAGDVYMHRSGLDQAGENIDTFIEFTDVTSSFSEPYDVYVYVGSDQDGRTGEVTLNSDPPIYFLSNTKDDEPGGHTQATATDAGSAFPSNYVLYEDVTGDSFTILERNIQGAGTVLHGIQIEGLPAVLLTGDMDCDGDVDFDDINPYVLGLNNPTLYQSEFGLPPSAKGDTDGDGDFDFDDITGFVDILSGGGAQGVPEPSTITLLGLGLFLSLYAAARRRRRQ